MLIKKLSICCVIIAICPLLVFAGGSDKLPHPNTLIDNQWHIQPYIDLHGGYSFQNWHRVVSHTTTIWAFAGGFSKNSEGGGIGGFDLGLQLTYNLALELGSYYLPEVKGAVNGQENVASQGCATADGQFQGEGPQCAYGSQYNWMAYVAGKFSMPMPYFIDGLNFYAKIGGVWRAMSNVNQTIVKRGGAKSYWDVIYGAGLDYHLKNSRFRFGVQWLCIPANINADIYDGQLSNNALYVSNQIAEHQPAANLLTGSIGYAF